MLPSGNDAAICLAEHFGQYLFEVATRYKNNKQQQQQTQQPSN
jgi:D-alanyl-D-alanine carboxypeptidase